MYAPLVLLHIDGWRFKSHNVYINVKIVFRI